MEREIKFRVFRKSDRLMRYLDNQMFLHSGGAVGWTENEGYIDDSPNYDEDFALMQYTGLKDKNGKEIYEGDILANREVHGDNFYCVVEYGIDGFNGVTYPGRNHCMPLHTIMTYEGAEYNEVIGNIYENPELLSKLNKE